MATVLKIYKTEITPARNARVDSIDTYLAKCGAQYVDSNFQFIKPQLDMTVNIDISSWDYSYITDRGNASLYPVFGNYLTLDLDTGASSKLSSTMRYYYFILEAKWVSDETVALKCSLDTINTFWDDFHWSPKTSIIREHVNRFASTSAIGGLSTNMRLNFKVDKASEGVAPARMIKTSDESVRQPNSPSANENWYLMYKTDNSLISNATSGSAAATNGLNCYLLPDNTYTIKKTGTAVTFNFDLYNKTENDRQYYCTGESNGTIGFTVNSDGESLNFIYNGNEVNWKLSEITIKIGDTCTIGGVSLECVAIGYWKRYADSKDCFMPFGIYKVVGGDTYYSGFFHNGVRVFLMGYISANFIWHYSYKSWDQVTLSSAQSYSNLSDLFGYASVSSAPALPKSGAFHINYATDMTYLNGNESILKIRSNNNSVEISNVSDIDSLSLFYDNGTSGNPSLVLGYDSLPDSALSDSKLVKIVQLPYCPSDITYDNGTYKLDGKFEYNVNDQSLKYASIRQNFKANLEDVAIKFYTTLPAGTSESRAFLTKSIDREPKLYHSDFYTYKLVYDGDYKQIKFEDIIPNFWTTYYPSLTITFSPTNTIGSSLGFFYGFKDSIYDSEEDFPVLLSSRDNSLPIYNNDYINYMRYTYATDINNLKATQQAKNTSIGLGVAGSAVSTIGGAIGGAIAIGAAAGTSAGPAGTIAGAVVGGIVGAATGIISTINAVQQADTNIANANRSLQSKILNLQNQPVTAQGAGAATDIMTEYSGNKLHIMTYEPDTLIKKAIYDKLFYCGYSHPVQEVPDFDSRFWFNFVQCTPVFTGDTLVFNKYLDDIKARFQIGVTDYHMHNLVTQYDWDQQYENWETRLVDGAEVVGHTYINGEFVTNTTGGVDMNISSSQDASLFTWTYLDENSTPVAINWSSTNKFNTTVHFASYPGPTLVIATYKADTSKTSDGEIDWP